MTVLVTILVALIGAAGAIFSAYMIARTNKQDRVLNRIEVTVNGRLTNALEEIKRMQELITQSRDTGAPVPPRFLRRRGERDYQDPDTAS